MNDAFTSLSAGIWSPLLTCRLDLEKRHQACRDLVNFVVLEHGGISRRPGLELCADLTNSTHRLIPFEASLVDAFVLCISLGTVEIFNNDGEHVASLDSPWGNSLDLIQYQQINDRLFLAHPDNPVVIISRNVDSWSIEQLKYSSYPWMNTSIRDTELSFELNGGKYFLNFNPKEKDSNGSVGDTIRLTTQIPTQTGYFATSAIFAGAVNIPLVSASTNVNEWARCYIATGGYYEWWTCMKTFTGSKNFAPGKTKLSDYPEYFEKGAYACTPMPCKGTWKFQCQGTWYGEYVVERKYSGGAWEKIGSSFSASGSPSNIGLTGDESDEECWVRLRVYQTTPTYWPDTGNKLVVDSYRKDCLFRLGSTEEVNYVESASTSVNYTRTWWQAYFKSGSSYMASGFKINGVPYPKITAIAVADAFTSTNGWMKLYPSNMPSTIKTTDSVEFGISVEQKEISLAGDINNMWLYAPSGADITASSLRGGYVEVHASISGASWLIGKWTLNTSNQTIHLDASNDINYHIYINGASSISRVTRYAGKGVFTARLFDIIVKSNSGGSWENVSTIPENVPASGTSQNWSWQAFRSAYGYPSSVAFHQNRIYLAGVKTKPQTIWASRTDSYTDFTIGSNADDGLMLTILSQSQDKIQWMNPESGLMVGTQSAEWLIDGDGEKAISPTGVKIKRQSSVGSAAFQPIIASNSSIYVSQSATRLQELAYSYERDGFSSTDLSILAEHVCKKGIKNVAYQRMMTPVIWCVLKDGSLAGCTYNRQQQVISWHRHEFGTREEPWKVETAAVIHDAVRNEPSGYDQLFLVVNTGTDRKLARLRFEPSVARYDDTGIPFTARCEMMPMDIIAADGNTLGKNKDAATALIRIHEGTELYAGIAKNNLTKINWSTLRDGWVSHTLTASSQKEPSFTMEHSKSEPLTILCINITWQPQQR